MASMAFAHGSKKRNLAGCHCNDGQLSMRMQTERITSALNMSRLGMNDRVLAYLVSLGIIGAGVIGLSPVRIRQHPNFASLSAC